jgi:hypothetical protein
MNLSNIYKPAKLTVTAYRDRERRRRCDALEAQYNPETLSVKHEVRYQPRQGIALSGSAAHFSYSPPQSLSVKLIFDGTQADNWGGRRLGALVTGRLQGLGVPTVGERIERLLDTCYQVRSDTHEPAYLRLTWGQGVLGAGFDCRLESADIKYTLFDRDGSPLRAELDAVFVGDLDPHKDAAAKRLASPDLSHRRRVASGDTLPLLCLDIYGSAEHYLRVAEVNGLDDFRVLEPGRELVFPPFAGPAEA